MAEVAAAREARRSAREAAKKETAEEMRATRELLEMLAKKYDVALQTMEEQLEAEAAPATARRD